MATTWEKTKYQTYRFLQFLLPILKKGSEKTVEVAKKGAEHAIKATKKVTPHVKAQLNRIPAPYRRPTLIATIVLLVLVSGWYFLTNSQQTESVVAQTISNTDDPVTNLQLKAQQGDAEAQRQLGFRYLRGDGVSENREEAVKWFRKAAEQEDAEAQFQLGFNYSVIKDESEAMKWYRKAAEQGNADAQNCLGTSYELGQGVDQDELIALFWHRKAAKQGVENSQKAMKLLKNITIWGPESLSVLHEKAAHDDVDALFLLGCYHEEHLENKPEALRWYKKAAELGDSESQNIMGFNSRDRKEAVDWYLKAAKQNNPNSQHWLYFAYLQGSGVAKDEDEAVKWLRKSAEQGHSASARILSSWDSPNRENEGRVQPVVFPPDFKKPPRTFDPITKNKKDAPSREITDLLEKAETAIDRATKSHGSLADFLERHEPSDVRTIAKYMEMKKTCLQDLNNALEKCKKASDATKDNPDFLKQHKRMMDWQAVLKKCLNNLQ